MLAHLLFLFQAAFDPSMSEMMVMMNLGRVTRADLCSVTASTSLAGQLILAAACADVNVCRDLAVQASLVRSASLCLQDLGLNLLELTIVAPLVSREPHRLHKFVPDVGDTHGTGSQTDQLSSTDFYPSDVESHVSTEQTSLFVQLQETTPSRSCDDSPSDKDVATDTFSCLQQLCCHR